MWNTELFQLGIVIIPTIPAILAVWVSWKNQTRLHNLHIEVNGRLTQLLSITEQAGFARGVLEGQRQIASITVVPPATAPIEKNP